MVWRTFILCILLIFYTEASSIKQREEKQKELKKALNDAFNAFLEIETALPEDNVEFPEEKKEATKQQIDDRVKKEIDKLEDAFISKQQIMFLDEFDHEDKDKKQTKPKLSENDQRNSKKEVSEVNRSELEIKKEVGKKNLKEESVKKKRLSKEILEKKMNNLLNKEIEKKNKEETNLKKNACTSDKKEGLTKKTAGVKKETTEKNLKTSTYELSKKPDKSLDASKNNLLEKTTKNREESAVISILDKKSNNVKKRLYMKSNNLNKTENLIVRDRTADDVYKKINMLRSMVNSFIEKRNKRERERLEESLENVINLVEEKRSYVNENDLLGEMFMEGLL